MKKIFISLSASAIIALMSGCGGSSGRPANVGYYQDSPVIGADYVCGRESGTTGKGGIFYFENNKGCTFKVGDIVLREVSAGGLNDGIVIREDDPKVAAFLLTLDIDSDRGEINIKDAVKKALRNASVKKVPENNTDLQTIKQKLKNVPGYQNNEVIDFKKAKEHLMHSIFAGKTFYIPDSEENEVLKVVFDSALTKVTEYSSDESQSNDREFTLDGYKASFSDEDAGYIVYQSQTQEYIIVKDEDGDYTRLYYAKSKAQAFLNAGGNDNGSGNHHTGASGGSGTSGGESVGD